MKQLVLIIAGLAFLAGVAYVLLRTDQAPLDVSAEEPLQAAAPAPPPAPVPSPEALSTEKFRALTAEAAKSLPTKDQAGAADWPPVVVAGKQFALVNEALKNEPTLAGDAELFYKDCAGSGQYPDSIRALCFANLKILMKRVGKAAPGRLVPPEIRSLADQMAR